MSALASVVGDRPRCGGLALRLVGPSLRHAGACEYLGSVRVGICSPRLDGAGAFHCGAVLLWGGRGDLGCPPDGWPYGLTCPAVRCSVYLSVRAYCLGRHGGVGRPSLTSC